MGCALFTLVAIAANTLTLSYCRIVDVTQRILREYPALNIHPIRLGFDTRGAAETLYIVLQVH